MFHVFHVDLGRTSHFNDFTIHQEISEDTVCSLWGRNLILNFFSSETCCRGSNPAIKVSRMTFYNISIASWFNLLLSFYVYFLYKGDIPVSFLWAFPFLSLTYYRTSNGILRWIYSVIFSACTLSKSVKVPCKHYAKYFCNSTQILTYIVSFILYKYRCI
jgi:hypothetical protein